jgi:transcriptional regulator with XRE-family HTH domain
MVRGPLEIDLMVGERIRVRRLMLKMSQTELGKQLSVSFQQVQKYEKGSNRVSASRLQRIADVLGVKPSYFFANQEGDGSDDAERKLMATPGAVDLLRAYAQIAPSIRRAIVTLVESLAKKS